MTFEGEQLQDDAQPTLPGLHPQLNLSNHIAYRILPADCKINPISIGRAQFLEPWKSNDVSTMDVWFSYPCIVPKKNSIKSFSLFTIIDKYLINFIYFIRIYNPITCKTIATQINRIGLTLYSTPGIWVKMTAV